MPRLRTQVGVIGAGPAGLAVANVLARAGIDCRVVERHPRQYVETRPRAGLLEHRSVRWLAAHGLAGRLLAEGLPHGWCDFLCLGRSVRVDYGSLSGGFTHWVYPQQHLVRDLIAALAETGAPPLFGRPVRAVTGVAEGRPVISCADGLEVACDYVLGCDGGRGVTQSVLAALPAAGRRVYRRRYPYDWLTVLAEVDVPPRGVVYGLSAEGFAGMMPRTGGLARFYLQCPPGESPRHWPMRRIVTQLRRRLAGAALPGIGAPVEVRVLRMRSSVTEPMGHGRLLLAGDAAHVLTPSGAKGMNLALADAACLADALLDRYRHGDERALAAYGGRRLAEVWRAQEFSDRLLRLLHLPPAQAGEDRRFGLRLRLAAIERLAEPGPHAAAFAHQYVGSGADGPPPGGTGS